MVISFEGAAARIGKSDLKNYAGTLSAGFTTLLEYRKTTLCHLAFLVVTFSLDVQDGQSVHASVV